MDNQRPFLSGDEIARWLDRRPATIHLRQRLGIENDLEARALRRANGPFFKRRSPVNLTVATILRLTGTYWLGRANVGRLKLRRNELHSTRLPRAFDGFTILHLSDLHADMSAPAMVQAARMVADLHYDLCVLTGDYRGRIAGPFQPALQHMQRLLEALKGDIYGVLGNHDTIRMVPDLESKGVRMLLNEHVAIERDGSRIFLCGIDDAHYYRVDNIEKAAEGIDPDAFSILLSHTPETFREACHAGFDLMLAGHTHGGQICLPGGVPIVMPLRLPRALGQGAWRYRGMAGYTSAGAGACGVPVRFNCPPEITLHRLVRAC